MAAARRSASLRDPDSRPTTRRLSCVLNFGNTGTKDLVMGMIQTAESFGEVGSADAVSALVAGLESEFGRGAGQALAAVFLAAEDTDFHWDARTSERLLGAYDSLDEEDFELDRVAIVGRLDGVWFTAIIIVDGEGRAHGMISRRGFRGEKAARAAWAHAR